MNKIFDLGGLRIKAVFKRNKMSRGVKMSLKADNSFLVSYPWFVSQKQAEKIFLSNEKWILESFKKVNDRPYAKLLSWGGRKDYLRNKERARDLVRERVEYFNQFYNFPYNRVAIRDQKTRWGSCSSSNNLNFNYRILFLPDELVDYLIVHELCHLREMNHSRNFWSLVLKTIPNYRQLSRKLRKV